jgi:hypothetical protein
MVNIREISHHFTVKPPSERVLGRYNDGKLDLA